MGREATITAEQVNAAADGMKADGIKPTSRAIRERLGNTGSMGTINKLLQRWKSGQERQAATALTLPPMLQRAVLEFMDQELTAARAALEAELADQQQGLLLHCGKARRGCCNAVLCRSQVWHNIDALRVGDGVIRPTASLLNLDRGTWNDPALDIGDDAAQACLLCKRRYAAGCKSRKD